MVRLLFFEEDDCLLPEYLTLLAKKYYDAGWNIYANDADYDSSTMENLLSAGPVTRLDKDIEYVALPKIADPSDLDSMITALGFTHTIANDFGYDFPHMHVNARTFAVKNFRFGDAFEVYFPMGEEVGRLALPYFVDSLRTLSEVDFTDEDYAL